MTTTTCPTADTMGRLAAGELAAEERDLVLDHVLACRTCREELALLSPLRAWADESAPSVAAAQLESASREHAPPRPVPSDASVHRFPGRQRAAHRIVHGILPWAAVLLLGLGGLFSYWHLSRTAPPDGAPSGVVRGDRDAFELQPENGAELREPPLRLQLHMAPAADAFYELQILDHELSLLWQSPPERAPSFDLPEPVRALLTPGTYHWRVLVEDDVQRSSLVTSSFTVAPNAPSPEVDPPPGT